MPENRKDAEDRAEQEGIPKTNVYCLDGDEKCYIAPQGITDTAAKRAYAEARDKGDDQETAAKIAWTVQNNIDESRSLINAATRSSKLTSEVRAETEQGKKLVIRGYAILFNNPTRIRDNSGVYEEVIMRTALTKTDLTDVKLLGGHNPDNLLGRTGVNLRLEVDDTGLFFESELPNTQLARDYYNLVESGILDGTSFMFTTLDEVRNGTRQVSNIEQLYEITLTPFPAYYESSVVAARQEAVKPIDNPKAEPVVETPKAEESKAEPVDTKAFDKAMKKLEEI